jgi:signal transduction histidine kinase
MQALAEAREGSLRERAGQVHAGTWPARLLSRLTFRGLMIVAVAGLMLGAGAVTLGLADIKVRADHAVEAWRTYSDRDADIASLLSAPEVAARDDVAAALDYVADAAAATMRLVLLGAVVMIGASVWLLGFRVVARVERLTRAMGALAEGDTHVEIPASADRDEIGAMSRALLVFRDGMENNLVLARELAETSRLASLGALVAGMAHELNTPIGNALSVATAFGEGMRCFTEEARSGRLRRTALEDFLRRTRDAAGLIERNLLRASQQIGSFKQIAVDQTGDQRRVFELDAALKDVVESMRPSVRRARASIALDAEPGVALDGYPGALTQVVCNLVENAEKHGLADRSGGMVRIAARRRGSDGCEVVVSDDGVGVPEALQSKVFDAFFTTRAGKGGSGLGLHIVNTIVSGALGGQVSVESRPGDGARFTIVLPLVAPERIETAESPKERVFYAAA